MTLGELIERLEQADPNLIVPMGFASPHSYRGYYDELAFEPRANILVSDMLAAAKDAMGSTYIGYKGGEYQMCEWTECWLAKWGECGETIGPILLGYMLGKYNLGVLEDR